MWDLMRVTIGSHSHEISLLGCFKEAISCLTHAFNTMYSEHSCRDIDRINFYETVNVS